MSALKSRPPSKPRSPKGEPGTGTMMKVLAECPMNRDAIALMDAADVLAEQLRAFAKNHGANDINAAIAAAGFKSQDSYQRKGEELLANAASLRWVLQQFTAVMECSAFPVLTPAMYEQLDEPTSIAELPPTVTEVRGNCSRVFA